MTTDAQTGATDTAPEAERSRRSRRSLTWWQEGAVLLVLALVTAFLAKTFLVQAFYIPSQSMEPGLVANDRIIAQKVSYWGDGEPEAGQVVVFEDPGGWLPQGGHLVKRVIGVAGDTIVCCDDQGRLQVNGEAIDESAYARPGPRNCYGPMPGAACDWTAGPVPEGHVFVMGDNRAHSADSSVHMCQPRATNCAGGQEFVPVDLVVGKVLARVWPLDRAGIFDSTEAFANVPSR